MWRAAVVAVALFGIWGVLAVRLGQLHLGANESLQARVRSMRSVKQEILVGRGRILDRNGNLLALDLTLQNVVVTPGTIVSNNQTRVVSQHLSRVLEMPYEQVFERVNRPWRQYEAIQRRVTEETRDGAARTAAAAEEMGAKAFQVREAFDRFRLPEETPRPIEDDEGETLNDEVAVPVALPSKAAMETPRPVKVALGRC